MYIHNVPLETRRECDVKIYHGMQSAFIPEEPIETATNNMEKIFKDSNALGHREWVLYNQTLRTLKDDLIEVKEKNGSTPYIIRDLHQLYTLGKFDSIPPPPTTSYPGDLVSPSVEKIEQKKDSSLPFINTKTKNKEEIDDGKVSTFGIYLPPKPISKEKRNLTSFFKMTEKMHSPLFDNAGKKDLKIRRELVLRPGNKNTSTSIECIVKVEAPDYILMDLTETKEGSKAIRIIKSIGRFLYGL